MSIQLGQLVRDVITGFNGVATGRSEYITGKKQIEISPRSDMQAGFSQSRWVDESRVEVNKFQESERLKQKQEPISEYLARHTEK